MALDYKEYILTNSAIEEISQAVQVYLTDLECESKQLHRIRLTVEEILIRLLEKSEGNPTINVAMGKHFGKHVFRMYYDGAPLDPTYFDEDDEWAATIMPALGLSPAWSYNKGKNNVTLLFSERKNRSTIINILIAIVVALVLGALGSLIPEGTKTIVSEHVLTPVIDGFFGLLKTFAGVMIAFTISNAIIGIGDSKTFGKLGKRVLFRMLLSLFIITAVSVIAMILLLGLELGGDTGSQSGWSDLSRMLFDIIPSNPIDPFLQGNAIQIIVISVFVGVGLISIGDRGKSVKTFFEEGAALTQNIVSMITRFIPVCVCLMLLRLMWSGDAKGLLEGWKPFVLVVVGEVILVGIMITITGIKVRKSPLVVLEKALPPYIVALTTASSLSAMTLGMDVCQREMGVDKKTVGFAYPLGSVIYKSATALTCAVMVCTMSDIYDVGISIPWIISAIITICLLTIAMPPIPGGGFMVYTVLFAALGIPSEAFIITAALETIIDFVDTGCNVLMLVLKVTQEAKPASR